jgi:hypothetical protein
MVDAMERSVKAGDTDDYHLLNLEFHDRWSRFTGNRKLTALYRKLINELSLFRRLNLADGPDAGLGQRAPRHRQGHRLAGDADGRRPRDAPTCWRARSARFATTAPGGPRAPPPRKDRPMLEVNGRSYNLPRQPTVVVCVDGCEPDYIAQAVAAGVMPWMARTLAGAPRWWPTAWCPASPTPTT